MHLQGDFLNAVRRSKSRRLAPVGNQHLVPLVIQNLRVILRPRARHPVGGFILRAAAGAAAETHDTLDAEPFGQKHRAHEIITEFFRGIRVRMNGIAVSAQRADFQMVLPEHLLKRVQLIVIVQKLCRVAMRFARKAAATDLDRLYAAVREVFHGLGKRLARQHGIKNR